MNEAMNSAIAIALAQQREEIAKRIEAMNEVYCCAEVRDEAASIARGMK